LDSILPLCSEDIAFKSVSFLLSALVLALTNIREKLLDIRRSIYSRLTG
jgi:hypothetical protein